MDLKLAARLEPSLLDKFIYTAFTGDTAWYSAAREEYDAIYMYAATENGITIRKIETHEHKSLPYSQVFDPTRPNGVTVYFPDTSNQGLSPYGATTKHLIFDMNPTTQIPQLINLLSIVRSDSPNLVPQLVETDKARPIWPGTPSGTALSHPLLRELLLVMALRSFVLQSFRLAPGTQDLVKHIALSGPPVVPYGVRVSSHGEFSLASLFHRGWVWKDTGSRWDFAPSGLRLRRDVVAALVRNGWRDPEQGLEYLEPPVRDDDDDSKAENNKKPGDWAPAAAPWRPNVEGRGMCDLVDALLHVGYLDTSDKRTHVLTKVARHGELGDVQFTLTRIDRGSITRAQECQILPAAAAGGKGRADVLVFLLNRGLDPNAVSQNHKRTALHEAIRRGDIDMVKVLLDAGANMVKDDEWGLPIELAEGLKDREDSAAKVALLEKWLEERGLPRDYVDLPVFVDETATSDKTRSWASSRTRCCKTCGARSGL